MKKFTILTIILLTISGLYAQQKYQHYTIKSGYIEYKVTGNSTGIRKMWWDDYGNKSRTESNITTVTKIFGISNETKEESVNVTKKNQFWNANLVDKVYQTGIYDIEENLAFYENMTPAEKKAFEKQMLDQYGGSIIGKETIMGYECDIISVMGAKSWVYKGIALKTEASVLGITITETVVKFDQNIAVPVSKFEPYPDVKYEDLGKIEVPNISSTSTNSEVNSSIPVQTTPSAPVLKCTYATFETIIKSSKIPGYKMVSVKDNTSNYNAMFVGFTGALTILGTSKSELTKSTDLSLFESFSHNGKSHYYSDVPDGSAIIVSYPDKDLYIMYIFNPGKSKDAMLEITDKFGF
jgi:hypothetical protein